MTYHRFRPGRQQVFGHRHDDAEEVYVVIGGSGRVLLDGEDREIRKLDAIRVAPTVVRTFRSGPDGLELLAFGPRRTDDRGELVQGWWHG